MKRSIYVSQTADRPSDHLLATFRERERNALLGSGEQVLHADGSFLIRIRVPGFPVAPPLRVAIGVAADLRDGRTVIPLTWAAETAELSFPEFDGAVEFEPLSSRATRVSIVGSYVPPFGPIGVVIDAAVLHRAADATAAALLARLLDGLADSWELPEPSYEARQPTSMTVGDVMTMDPFVVDASLPVKTTALLLFHLDVSGAPVVGPAGELVGVVTERDLLDKEAAPPQWTHAFDDDTWRRREAKTAGEVCSRPARTTASSVSLREAASEMQRQGVGRLVVVDHVGIAGIVTRHDVLLALIRSDEELQRAAKDLLQELDEEGITARVDWGIVSLSGMASRRSRCDRAIERVTAIDGVMGVNADDLEWLTDDVTPLTMPPVA